MDQANQGDPEMKIHDQHEFITGQNTSPKPMVPSCSEEVMDFTEQATPAIQPDSAPAHGECTNMNDVDLVKKRMVHKVANSDGHFKHQQRGEPDFTYSDKLTIAVKVLEEQPATFLSRFSKFLSEEDTVYFNKMKADYTINFYIKEILKRRDVRKSRTKVRNRRYEAMKILVDKKEYFSDKEMKSRDPLLYEQMVGKYLTDDEIQTQASETDGSISSVLMQHIEAIHNNELYAKQMEVEDSQMEEEDSDSEDECDHDDDEEEDEEEWDEEEEEDDEDAKSKKHKPKKKMISDTEKLMLRQEFEAAMQQRFLSGQDNEFDYAKVDDNVEYDSLDIRTQDEEERYFDEDTDSASSLTSKTSDFVHDSSELSKSLLNHDQHATTTDTDDSNIAKIEQLSIDPS